MNCPTCQQPLALPFYCTNCQLLLAETTPLSSFELFNLPTRYSVDQSALESAFLRLSRLLHPDYFTLASPEQQQLSEHYSSRLNEAYRVLRDPYARCEYLLKLLAPENVDAEAGQKLSPDFLEAMLEIRMELEEAIETRDQASLARITSSVDANRGTILRKLETTWGDVFGAAAPDQPTPRLSIDTYRAIKQQLHELKYLDNVLAEIKKSKR